MPKYKVEYVHSVEITYEAIVEAETADEAYQKAVDGEIVSEEEIDYQGLEYSKNSVEEVD